MWEFFSTLWEVKVVVTVLAVVVITVNFWGVAAAIVVIVGFRVVFDLTFVVDLVVPVDVQLVHDQPK